MRENLQERIDKLVSARDKLADHLRQSGNALSPIQLDKFREQIKVLNREIRKEIKHYKKEAQSEMEDLLLDTVGRLGDDMKYYKEESLDWSWDNILEGGS